MIAARQLWLDFSLLGSTSVQFDKETTNCFYELGPTGRAHAGIARTLLRMADLADRVTAGATRLFRVLHISDRAGLRDSDRDQPLARPVRMIPSPGGLFRSLFDWSRHDLLKTLTCYQTPVEQTTLDSDFYESDAYRELAKDVLARRDQILWILARTQSREPRLFHPVCPKCELLYTSTNVTVDARGDGTLDCSICRSSSRFSVFENAGTFTFKVELALKWRWLAVDLHFTSPDHLDGIRCAQSVTQLLGGTAPRVHLINLTMERGRGVMHKSKGNFTPVNDLHPDARAMLRARLLRQPDRRLLVIRSYD